MASRPVRRSCPSCLLYEGMSFLLIRDHLPEQLLRSFGVPSRGPCTLCRAYRQAFDPDAVASDLTLFEVVMGSGGSRPVDALVAVSGGKDSLSTLLCAVERGWKVAAVLFDNGFVPAPVVDQTRRVCQQLRVPLHVRTGTAAWRRKFASHARTSTLDEAPPCDACAGQIHQQLAEVADELGVRSVVTGTNYFAAWTDRPYALAVPARPGGRPLSFLNLPYALGTQHAKVRRDLLRLQVQPANLPGLSTNCTVPSLVQERLGAQLGHVPELETLALEVMVGHLTRTAALRQLARKAKPS